MQTNYTFFALASLLLLSGCSRIVVKHLPATDPPALADGVIYALPKTVVRVQAKIDMTTAKDAPYSAYSRIFAPNLDPVCPDKDCAGGKVEYSVENGATFSSYGEPDPDQVFLVKFSGAGAVDQSLSMTWNDAGLFSSATSTVTNRTTDVILSTIGTAASLASKVFLGSSKPGAPAVAPLCDEVSTTTDKAIFKMVDDGAQVMSPDVKMAVLNNYCAIEKATRDKLDLALFPKALQSYDRTVSQLVARRGTLLLNTGGVFDPTALIGRLDIEITAKLIPLFIGTKTTATWNAMLDTRNITEGPDGIIPPVSLLRFGANGAEVMAAEVPPEGDPEPGDFKKATSSLGNLTLKLSYRPAKQDQLFTKVVDDTKGDRSFRYRIPAQVKASFEDSAGKSYGGATLAVAQLGKIISLPASRHSKSLTYTLGMVEATGALKSFALSTTGGVDAGSITSLGTSAGTVLDARTAAAAKAAAAADPSTALTRQDTLLKLQDDICTIQAKYNIPCSVQPK